jgi:hypothetical protein
MAVRSTMADLIALVRTMIADPAGASQQFTDQQIQDRLDSSRDDIRYENLRLAPSIVNTASTSNIASYIFADYFSDYGWWEADVVLQGYLNAAYWKVLTPVVSELLLEEAHWAFETSVFTTGTVPGQLPPIFATGKIYDVYSTSADLLEFWAATYMRRFDFSSDAQSFKASQIPQGLRAQADYYRQQCKPNSATMNRRDIGMPLSTRRMQLLDSD